MESVKLNELLKLPVDERLRLIDALWESLRESPDALELTPAQREELDRRWRAYQADPDAGSPWPAVRDRIVSDR
jgi:putative addiction module component (TIGR02574 family)